MINEIFVRKRLRAMHDRPQMWASSTEAFGLQLVLLVEVFEVFELSKPIAAKTPTHVAMERVFGPGNTVLNAPLEEVWAINRVNQIYSLLRIDP